MKKKYFILVSILILSFLTTIILFSILTDYSQRMQQYSIINDAPYQYILPAQRSDTEENIYFKINHTIETDGYLLNTYMEKHMTYYDNASLFIFSSNSDRDFLLQSQEVAISSLLAKKLNISVGDTLSLSRVIDSPGEKKIYLVKDTFEITMDLSNVADSLGYYIVLFGYDQDFVDRANHHLIRFGSNDENQIFAYDKLKDLDFLLRDIITSSIILLVILCVSFSVGLSIFSKETHHNLIVLILKNYNKCQIKKFFIKVYLIYWIIPIMFTILIVALFERLYNHNAIIYVIIAAFSITVSIFYYIRKVNFYVS